MIGQLRSWVAALKRQDPRVQRVGYFGSYARGDWGVGSDLDVVVVMSEVDEAPERRRLAVEPVSIPVPCDLLVYTEAEWNALLQRGHRFARVLASELRWV